MYVCKTYLEQSLLLSFYMHSYFFLSVMRYKSLLTIFVQSAGLLMRLEHSETETETETKKVL